MDIILNIQHLINSSGVFPVSRNKYIVQGRNIWNTPMNMHRTPFLVDVKCFAAHLHISRVHICETLGGFLLESAFSLVEDCIFPTVLILFSSAKKLFSKHHIAIIHLIQLTIHKNTIFSLVLDKIFQYHLYRKEPGFCYLDGVLMIYMCVCLKIVYSY